MAMIMKGWDEMDKKSDEESRNDANLKLNREFYGGEAQPTGWVENTSLNETVNANIEIDRQFYQDDDEFDLNNTTTIRRGNG
jgi:hypothetical protein